MSRETFPKSAPPVGRLLNLIPVGLKEAAIDSPTSRASIVHFGEQVDLIERWLEDYVKSAARLIAEYNTLENILTSFTSYAVLPAPISESMVDHDYSLLAMKKYSEGAKDYWASTISVMKRLSILVVEPIRAFLQTDLRSFKDIRRNLELSQKSYDSLQAKYASLGKSKEPSSLREDAFQLHEARKAYLKASMDFFTATPQLRFSTDRLLIRVFFDQWKEMRVSRDSTAAAFQRNAHDMERIKGWTREMENSEKALRRELLDARKELEDAAEMSHRPSRDLSDYSISTVPALAGQTHSASEATITRSPRKPVVRTGEKHGWLFLRTYTTKPSRVVYVRKWAFVRNGVFGWLVQGTRAGGVEESERIGVLLCNVRPAPGEDRRFCFELKTNKSTIGLQAETQAELSEWISAFEAAKSKALEDPGSTDTLATTGNAHSDPAFAITPAPVPEFGTTVLSLLEPVVADDVAINERMNSLPGKPENEIAEFPRRSTTIDGFEGVRDHGSRLLSKLDVGKKSSSSSPVSSTPMTPGMGGGIASLIAASHGSMPVGPILPMIQVPQPLKTKSSFKLALRDMPPNSLAPSTLASPPAPTNLSKAAVVVTGERGTGVVVEKNGIPNGLLANTWGSSDLSYVNRPRGESRIVLENRASEQPSPLVLPAPVASKEAVPSLLTQMSDPMSVSTLDLTTSSTLTGSRAPSPQKRHQSTVSLDTDLGKQTLASLPDFPNYYPTQLKTQDAQFRLLFPRARKEERLVMVFRATRSPNDQQEFPGRLYVTTRDIYFYSNHLGLVLTVVVSLSIIDEVTAAPGRDCDFLFLHLKEGTDDSTTRVTLKVFLEPLKLLQRRLNFLIQNSTAEEPFGLESVIKTLLKIESEAHDRSPSVESWEDGGSDRPGEGGASRHRTWTSTFSEFKSPTRVDKSLHNSTSIMGHGDKSAKFKLPAQPVVYTPSGNLHLAVERDYEISPKALYHVLFGDRSVVWQLLQHERRAQSVKQGPWINLGEGRLRRDFELQISTFNAFGRPHVSAVRDYQVIDVSSDHLCYVVTDKRTAWHLPYRDQHHLVSKVVITHIAKGRCKLAIFIKIEWRRKPWLVWSLIERYALSDLELDALDLADIISDQVGKLGARSRTKRAVEIFGPIGQSTEATQFQIDSSAHNIEMRRTPVQRTVFYLVLRSSTSTAQHLAGIFCHVALDLTKWIYKTCTANSVVLALLFVSIFYNSWYSSRDTLDWWHERNAGKFMKRIGIEPNRVMGKAVYTSNLDEMLSQNGLMLNREDSACYSTFYDTYQLEDLNAPIAPSSAPGDASRQRMQVTRRKLGTYRHDLVVAMRVVNSIEKELVQTEWEKWVQEEHRRCRQIEEVLEGEKESNSTVVDGLLEGEVEDRKWFEEYCGSCKKEHEQLASS